MVCSVFHQPFLRGTHIANLFTDTSHRRFASLADKVALGASALLLGLSVYMHFAVTFWGDQDWELLVARMMLEGRRLYVDHVPVTAPLLFTLYTLPVLVSQHVSFLADYQALALLNLCVIAGVIGICVRLIALHPGFATASMRLQFGLLLCFLLVFRIIPQFFADREHLLIVLTLPYLLRWMPGLSDAKLSVRLRLLIGSIAAVGFFVKPHCLLVFAALQLVGIVRMRSLRILASPENGAIYLLGALYGLAVWHYTPEYLTLVLPMAYFTYSAIQAVPGNYSALALCVILTFAMLRPGVASPYRRDIWYCTALLPFFYLYARINNGWAYSYQPLMTLLLLTNGLVLWEFLYLRRSGALPRWKPVLGAALCLLNFALQIESALDYYHRVFIHPCRGDSACHTFYQPFLDALGAAPRARSFGAIGMDFVLWARVSKLSGADWVTRFPQLWMMPKFFTADDTFYAAHQGIFYYVAGALAEDLERNKPAVVFVEVSNTLYRLQLQRPLDWVGDFSAVPAFRQAWEHYTLARTIDNCDVLPPSEDALTKRPKGMKVKESNCRFELYRRVP